MDLTTRKSRRLTLPGEQRGARFSPDGKWIAYQSKVGGSSEVQLRDWRALTARYVVTTDGGEEPSWSADGRTLFYRRRGDMMAVTITESTGAIAASAPRVVIDVVLNWIAEVRAQLDGGKK